MAEQFFPAGGIRNPFWMCLTILGGLSLCTAALGVLILWYRDIIIRDG